MPGPLPPPFHDTPSPLLCAYLIHFGIIPSDVPAYRGLRTYGFWSWKSRPQYGVVMDLIQDGDRSRYYFNYPEGFSLREARDRAGADGVDINTGTPFRTHARVNFNATVSHSAFSIPVYTDSVTRVRMVE